ncbi:hypothetical protein PIB30_072919 [Stylosanthes scabra]|uniref:Uncharacterized protein n=1 Tax=Stylosanthes scabra TaxID=79078 RepID=A0ABU6UPU9_9FABA|nr:hypothetical protein [Stylosanthes scabra]
MPTSLGISEARNWRIVGGDERLNMRTAMDCAWMLDGTMDNCVYALSLASRAPSRLLLQNFINCLGPSRFDWSPNRFVFTLISNLTFKMPSKSILPLLNRF